MKAVIAEVGSPPPLGVGVFTNILSEINKESFEGMTVQDIKDKKLDIVRQHGLANLY